MKAEKNKPMRAAQTKTLQFRLAIERMRAGARLINMHGSARDRHWFIIPGGPVTDETAEQIRQHPSIDGEKDGLFPGHDQTYRMRSFAGSA